MTQDDIIKSLQKVAEYFYDGKLRNLAVVDACEKAINKETGKEIYKHSMLEQPQDAEQFFENGKKIAKWADEQNKQPAQELVVCHCGNPTFNLQTITHTKKKCFEQTAQEPVAWTDEYKNFLEWDKESLCDKAVCKDHEAIPLYTYPAPSWQELSLSEINDGRDKIENDEDIILDDAFVYGAQWAEQALKEKNHG